MFAWRPFTVINHSEGQLAFWFARYIPSFTESRDAAAHQALAQGLDNQKRTFPLFELTAHSQIAHIFDLQLLSAMVTVVGTVGRN